MLLELTLSTTKNELLHTCYLITSLEVWIACHNTAELLLSWILLWFNVPKFSWSLPWCLPKQEHSNQWIWKLLPQNISFNCNQVDQVLGVTKLHDLDNVLGITGTYHVGFTFEVPCRESKKTLYRFHLKNY